MASALKEKIDRVLVDRVLSGVLRASNQDTRLRLKLAPLLTKKMQPLELKGRVALIAEEIAKLLSDCDRPLQVVAKAAEIKDLTGFEVWPLTHFIQVHGLDDLDESMRSLAKLTTRFTAEFALRTFLKEHPQSCVRVLKRWARSENLHLRRAASEGLRPFLPWAERVDWLIQRPEVGLDILRQLRFDPEIYVRRSVANHLNDLSKIRPELVLGSLAEWDRQCPEKERKNFRRLKSHALRTLLKQGHQRALREIGISGGADQVELADFKFERSRICLGDDLVFQFLVRSRSRKTVTARLDYIMGFRGNGDSLREKVFRLRTIELGPKTQVLVSARFKVRRITTRNYHSGRQTVSIQVNGVRLLTNQAWFLRL